MPRLATVACALILGCLLAARPAGSADDPPAALHELRALLDAGRYDEADRRATALGSDASVDESSRALTLRQLQVEARVRNGRGAEPETLVMARGLAARPAAAAAPATAVNGTSHRLLGDVLFERGDYRAALREYVAASRIHEATTGPASADLADDLERTSLSHMWLDQYPAASRAIDRAIAIAEARPPDARLARLLTTRGLILHRRGRYPAASADLTRALDLRRSIGPRHPDSVAVFSLAGDQLWFDGRLAAARTLLAEAVAVAEASLRAGHPATAEALRLQAITLDNVGEFEGARMGRERAVRIVAAVYGPDHPQYALQLHDLALSHINRGDYGEARRLLTQALAIYRTRLGSTHSEIGSTLHNLGTVAANLGDFALAESLQRRAAASWERSVGASHPVFPWALVALGEALAGQGRNAAALPILQRALRSRERILGANHLQVAATLNALARCLSALRRFGEAAPLVDRAIGIWEREGAGEGLSAALLIRAGIGGPRGDHLAARADAERAVALRVEMLGTDHPSVGEARLAFAGALSGLGQTADAFAQALEGERITREHIRLTTGYLPEAQALGYAAARTRGLDLALSLVATRGDARFAFDALVRGRSVVLDEMAMRQRLRATAAGQALQPLWAALTAASRRLANLTARGPADATPESYLAELERARRDRVAAEAALAERSAAARGEMARRDIGLDKLRTNLPEDSALVSFVRYDRISYSRTAAGIDARRARPSYGAFVVRHGADAPAFIPLGQASDVEAIVQRWRTTAIRGITASGGVLAGAERALRSAGTSLRARIWDPIAPSIAEARRVFIVPDGAINLVTFAALPVGDAGYLVDGPATIHYLSAERDLVEFDTRAPTTGRGLLSLGGPAYGPIRGSAPVKSATSAAGRDAPGDAPGRRSGCGSLDTMVFEPLPASRREAEDIGALWQALGGRRAGEAEAVVLTGARAGEGEFKRLGPGHRVLHLATHGFFLGRGCDADGTSLRGVSVRVEPKRARPRAISPDNPLLLSGLALAGANRRFGARPTAEDGILTAEEVAAMPLDGVEWAVLSACDSGLGTILGGEGVFGLRRAFQSAGARTVIMSLWPVEDVAARVWMRALYKARLENQASTADAMRQASVAVLAERRTARSSTHPFYWAGFVAAGDWR